jgi:peptidoglycan/xylan/chitin deacetylase (PgdA/CDA1 family)
MHHSPFFLSLLLVSTTLVPATLAVEPVPEKLVVLTFDDSSKSHFTVARPLLLKHKFNATFFITEGFDFPDNKKDYMTWQEITQLHKDGFEIGNHTVSHMGINDKNLTDLPAQLRGINAQCEKYGIPMPVSFAYPGNAITPPRYRCSKIWASASPAEAAHPNTLTKMAKVLLLNREKTIPCCYPPPATRAPTGNSMI